MKTDFFLQSTGYPVGLSKIARDYWEALPAMQGIGGNLDAPDWLLTGRTFYAPTVRQALPGITPRME